jgi:hypothetical protein
MYTTNLPEAAPLLKEYAPSANTSTSAASDTEAMPAIKIATTHEKDFLVLAFIPRPPPFQKGKIKLLIQSMVLVR